MIVPAAQIGDDVPAGPALDPDPLLRRLDLVLTGGTLAPRQFQIIREAMLRVGPADLGVAPRAAPPRHLSHRHLRRFRRAALTLP